MDPEENKPAEVVEEPAAVEQPAEAPVVETPEDAFERGVKEATPADEPAEPVETPEDAPKPEGEEGEPKPEQPKPEESKPEEQPKSVDEEIKELGITNERTQARFRELSERAAEADQYKGRAAKADEWEQTIQSTGTNPEQFGAALNYLRAVNSGSPEAMSQAYDIMEKELQWLGEKLGKAAPGFDPLSKHEDLKQKVASGDMTPEVAAELAQHRSRGQLATEHQQAQQTQSQQQAEWNSGMAQIQALGNQLRSADPQFQQKFAMIAPTLEIIQANLPPSQWATAIHNAYQKLPSVPAPAPAPAKPATPSPIRANGASMMAKPKTDLEAFDQGVSLAKARGM